jgi:NADH-quinone oxidoreductase subunit J
MLAFYAFGAVAILASLLVIAQRNPIYSVLLLIASFGALSGLYVLLEAPFVAVIQIVVYAGAIMVLFLFVIMLLSLTHEGDAGPRLSLHQVVGGVAAVGVFAGLVVALVRWRETLGGIRGHETLARFGTLEQVGGLLYARWLLPFEAVSLLLLVAMVGAVVVAKPRI